MRTGMDYPNLYSPGETRFTTDGIGTLKDAISCEVTEERNGAFSLSMVYPMSGLHFGRMATGCIIKARPNETASAQLFCICEITKASDGKATIYAEHISYKLYDIPVPGFSASGNPHNVMVALLRAAVTETGFRAESDISTARAVNIKEPCSVRECLMGQVGGVLYTFHGEYTFDNYTVRLSAARGRDTGAVIEYGKNLTDARQEESIADMYTAIMPYAHKNIDDTEQYTYIPEKYVLAPTAAALPYPRILPVDFSDKFGEGEAITAARLRELAQAYISNNDVGVPKVSLAIGFVQLWQTEEYKGIAPLERLNLCDTVTVKFARLGIDVTAKVVKTVYDVLKGRNTSLELGDARSNFTSAVKDMQQSIVETAKKSDQVESLINDAVKHATALMTGGMGGHALTLCNADGKPQAFAVMDTEDRNTAKKLWLWNEGGFAHSDNGINGPFDVAITMDGYIIGKYIIGLTIVGSQIIAGIIKSPKEGGAYFDMEANDGYGELAASTLIAPRNDNQTKAYIGTATYAGGRDYEALQITTKRFLGGGAAICVDGGNDDKEWLFPLANRSDFESTGNLLIRSNAHKDNPGTNNAIRMYTNRSGEGLFELAIGHADRSQQNILHVAPDRYHINASRQPVFSIDSGGGIDLYPQQDFYVVAKGKATIYAGNDIYLDSQIAFRITARGCGEISCDHNGIILKYEGKNAFIGAWDRTLVQHERKVEIGAAGFIRASFENSGTRVGDLYSNGVLVKSDRVLKDGAEEYGSGLLPKIRKAKVYQYRLKQDAVPMAKKSRDAGDAHKATEFEPPDPRRRIGIMYDEAPEEIRHETEDGAKQVDLYGMCAMLWGAVQELSAEIEALKGIIIQ